LIAAFSVVGFIGYHIGETSHERPAPTAIEDIPKEPVRELYDNGGVREEYYIVNGKKDGVATYYYPSGRIAWVGTFRDGKREGPKIYFDDHNGPNGKPLATAFVIYVDDKPTISANIFEANNGR
jgi:hypothetical protein